MVIKRRRKKAATLVEVIISIAIFSLLVLPTMSLILTSIKNVKKTNENEKAEIIGKQVIEEIKSMDLSRLENSIELGNGIVLNKNEDGTITTRNNGEKGFQTIDDNYQVEVTLTKNSNLEYSSISDNMDGEFNIYHKDGKLFIQDVKAKDDEGIKEIRLKRNQYEKITITNKYNLDEELNLIEIKLSSGEVINIKKRNKNDEFNKETGYIKFNLLGSEEDTLDKIKINIDVKNLMSQDFNIYISKRENSNFETEVNIDKDSIGGMLITDDIFTPNKIGDMYNLSVVVKKDSKILFNAEGYKNIDM